MLFSLIQIGIEFVKANAAAVAIAMGIMSYIKQATSGLEWRKPWMLTVAAFILAFAFTVPESGVIEDWLTFAFQGGLLGLTLTGVYDALKK
jgi:Cu/Ag efflux pump CusA